jgi:hypothetical protein
LSGYFWKLAVFSQIGLEVVSLELRAAVSRILSVKGKNVQEGKRKTPGRTQLPGKMRTGGVNDGAS